MSPRESCRHPLHHLSAWRVSGLSNRKSAISACVTPAATELYRRARGLWTRREPSVRRADFLLFVLWSAAWLLASAHRFYSYMLAQTGGEWSAPLDDVFIHFDYARATAQGAPFQWVLGNGYSSGNTSLTYPFALAAGFRAGFTGPALMQWAAWLALLSTFVLVLLARRWFLATQVSRVATYLIAPLVTAVGALAWSLWSGMEVAWFLGLWALAFDRAHRAAHSRPGTVPYWQLALTSVLVFYTRPEAIATTACTALYLAFAGKHPKTWRAQLLEIATYMAPTLCALALQTASNYYFTGETAANGAIVKLAVNNPHMPPLDKLSDYTGNVRYAIQRNIEYHFSDSTLFFFVLPALGALPLFFKKTRPLALLLWAHVLLWAAFVGLNGQVRWQNERYTMPGVAWLCMLAALGCGATLTRTLEIAPKTARFALSLALTGLAVYALGIDKPAIELGIWTAAVVVAILMIPLFNLRPARVAFAAVGLALFYAHQASKIRGQTWFFGRASRNIRDQQTTVGRALRAAANGEASEDARKWGIRPVLASTPRDPLSAPFPMRVMVGDAGAILYASEWQGVDAIGLGGYQRLPFARASTEGLAATIELVERMPERERPTHLALFPSWWGILPTWFSSGPVARFPAPGNVICGDYEHVLYKADWHLLGSGTYFETMPAGYTQQRDAVDLGDIVSEREHQFDWAPRHASGWTQQRILPSATDPKREIWDAARRIAGKYSMHFTLKGLDAGKPAALIFRLAPEAVITMRITVNGMALASERPAVLARFQELVVPVPATQTTTPLRVDIANDGPADLSVFHVYVVQ
jgi:hypothetical protein